MSVRCNSALAVFVLFFGFSLLEAVQTGNCPKALFWLAIGVVFLLADNFKAERPV